MSLTSMEGPCDASRGRWGWLFVAATVLIVVPGVLLRIIGLDHNPPGLWQDEASTGFDAYLLWTTGHDRAGKFLPIIAASFGDYPLTLYRYLTAPIVGLFGLSPGTERLTAALSGSLLILATGLFVLRRLGGLSAIGAMLSAAFAPIWVHFSRYGSEAILLPACLMLGAALIEVGRAPRQRPALWAGAVALAASAYTYHAVKVVLPLWMAAYLVYLWPLIRELWARERRHVIGPTLVFAALVLPSVLTALTPEGMARGRVVMAWHHYRGWDLPAKILEQWLGYFDPDVLFLRGGPHLAQSIPGVGIFNLIDLPLMVLGFVAFARGYAPRLGPPQATDATAPPSSARAASDTASSSPPRATDETAPPSPARVYGFLVFWFLLGPLPGGMTYETQNVGRAIAWLPVPQILSGVGLAVIGAWVVRPYRDQAGVARRVLGAALAIALAAIWVATGRGMFRRTLLDYPRLAEREFQFEISSALRCARAQRTDEKIVVSPNLVGREVVETFVGFYFGDLFEVRGGSKAWELGVRQEVKPGEIYVTNAGRAPVGRKLCELKTRGGAVVAEVYGHLPVPEPEPSGPPALLLRAPWAGDSEKPGPVRLAPERPFSLSPPAVPRDAPAEATDEPGPVRLAPERPFSLSPRVVPRDAPAEATDKPRTPRD